jgi:hypothetical protein
MRIEASISRLGTRRGRVVTVGVMMRVMMLLATNRVQTVAARAHIFQAFKAVI